MSNRDGSFEDKLQTASYGSDISEVKTSAISSISNSLLDTSYVSTLKNLGKWVELLQDTVPYGSEGPNALINVQKVAERGFLTDIESFLEQPMETYAFKVDRYEGFPTIEGLPIWERLEGELVDHYNLFKHYRDQKEKSHLRMMHKVAEVMKIPVPTLSTLAKTYHWRIRSEAYDQYKETLWHQERAKMTKLMLSEHRRAAKDLFQTANTYLSNNLEKLDPKTATALLEAAVKLERMSLGLSPTAPAEVVEERQNNQVIQINGGNVSVNQGVQQQLSTELQTDGGQKANDILAILLKAGAFAIQSSSEASQDAESNNGTRIVTVVPIETSPEILPTPELEGQVIYCD